MQWVHRVQRGNFVKETNASVEAKGKDNVNKPGTKAKAEADLAKSVMGELEQQSNYKCRNPFQVRGRGEELRRPPGRKLIEGRGQAF